LFHNHPPPPNATQQQHNKMITMIATIKAVLERFFGSSSGV
jgi:hypothetical protein